MPEPKNKIASDEQIIEAIKAHKDYKSAAESLGMAKKTLTNRLYLMRKRQPRDRRPNTASKPKHKRLFISCAVSGAPIHKKFFDSLKHLDADQIYIPVEYDWSDVKLGKHEPTYPEKIADKLLSEDIIINKHLMLMASVPLHATLANPLTGLKHVSHNKSAIFAHPQKAMEPVATKKMELPKLLYTTGAITEPRYTRSKTGRKAHDLHCIGGVIVEYTNDRFYIFDVTANDDGSFYHLDKKYTTKGVEESSVSAIYMADEHYDFYPEEVKKATYHNKDSIVNTLNPDIVIRGDVYNHTADSHHNRKDIVYRYLIDKNNRKSVREELDGCFDHIRETSGDYKNVILSSNHHDHLTRWLNEYNPHTGDIENALLYHELNADMLRRVDRDNKRVDAFRLYAELYHPDVYENCIFLGREEEFDVNGTDCSNHGDERFNGANGGMASFAACGIKTIIGHGHSPARHRNVLRVGACALDMLYNNGYSGWMVTHGIVYPDGNDTHVHVIDGEWRI